MGNNLRALIEKAGGTRFSRGLAESEARLCQGAVYVIPREAAPDIVQYPNLRLPNAGPAANHDCRLIVLTPSALCDDDDLNTVHVVPCSTSARGNCSPLDLDLTAVEGGFNKPSRAYVTIVQPALKSDLRAAGRTGVVSEATLQAMLARWMRLQRG